jgi:hypothetical protein
VIVGLKGAAVDHKAGNEGRNPSYTVERGKTEKVSVWVFAIPIIRRAEECFCATRRAKRDASICEEAAK